MLSRFLPQFSVFTLLGTALAGSKACPPLGSGFTQTANLSASDVFSTATANLTKAFNEAIQSGHSWHGPFPNSTASRYKSSQQTQLPSTNSTIPPRLYRRRARVGDAHWIHPVTKYVPELRHSSGSKDGVDVTAWDEITLGSLASHMSGIPRDQLVDLGTLPGVDWPALGFPPLGEVKEDIPPCNPSCSREDFFRYLLRHSPVYPTFTTPIYSNNAFQILGYALENMTNRTFQSMLEEDVFLPLGLTHSSYRVPNDTTFGVIPGDKVSSGWDFEFGGSAPTGNLFSSSNDMSSFGRAILNSTLLSPLMTRRWMHPVAHTSSLHTSVGLPWEILRFPLPKSNRIVDTYSKHGSTGVYEASLALLPEYGVGISILSAAAPAGAPGNVDNILGMVGDLIIPALEESARVAADRLYSGLYSSASTSANSSILITTREGQPGLGVSSWISNGIDMLRSIPDFLAPGANLSLSLRLYPTFTSSNRHSFRGVFESLGVEEDDGPLSVSCRTWTEIDQARYGNVGVDEFVFTVGEDGKVGSLAPRALRTELARA